MMILKSLSVKKAKSLAVKASVVTSMAIGSVSAFAAEEASTLPSGAQAAIDEVGGMINGFIDAAWPIVGTIVVASIGIKLFKKFANKAT